MSSLINHPYSTPFHCLDILVSTLRTSKLATSFSSSAMAWSTWRLNIVNATRLSSMPLPQLSPPWQDHPCCLSNLTRAWMSKSLRVAYDPATWDWPPCVSSPTLRQRSQPNPMNVTCLMKCWGEPSSLTTVFMHAYFIEAPFILPPRCPIVHHPFHLLEYTISLLHLLDNAPICTTKSQPKSYCALTKL